MLKKILLFILFIILLNSCTNYEKKLYDAILDKNFSDVHKYINRNNPLADINYRYSYNHYTPLHFAVRFSNYDIVYLLLINGVNVNKIDMFEQHALFSAVEDNKFEIADLLLEYGSNLDIRFLDNEKTCLHYAVKENNIKMVKLLLSYGADINVKSFEETAYMIAKEKKYDDICKLLVANGADTNIVKFNKQSVKKKQFEYDFPLQKGNYWIYEGKVKWGANASDKYSEKIVQWKMEVVETINRKNLTAAIIKGGPWDLTWYDDSITSRGNYIILYHSKKYYLIYPNYFNKILQRVKNKQDELIDIVNDNEMILSFPLSKNKKYPAGKNKNEMGFYNWIVQDTLSSGNNNCYGLTVRKLLDYTKIRFVPGIGITSFKYVHHGTVSECNVQLVEFRINK